jgi:hypothetical protein
MLEFTTKQTSKKSGRSSPHCSCRRFKFRPLPPVTAGQRSALTRQPSPANPPISAAATAIGLTAATALAGSAESGTATTTVKHRTSDAGAQAIADFGGLLESWSYVTTPGEIPAMRRWDRWRNYSKFNPADDQIRLHLKRRIRI